VAKPGSSGFLQFGPQVSAGLNALTAAGITVTSDGADAIRIIFSRGQAQDEALANTEFSYFIDTLIALARDRNIRRIDGGIFDKLERDLCPWHPFC
jgi:hypothetical protein